MKTLQQRIEQAAGISAATCAREASPENNYNVIVALKGTIAGLLSAISEVAGEDADMPAPDRRAEFREWIAVWEKSTERARNHVRSSEYARLDALRKRTDEAFAGFRRAE